MAASTAVTVFLPLLLLLLLLLLQAAAAAPPPSPPTPLPYGCAGVIVQLSPCLPYVSSPPNDLASSAPPPCCATLSSVRKSGFVSCLCYLLREPAMLGFPINSTRLRSLPSDCSLADANSTRNAADELDSLCSGSPPLPPLRGAKGSDIETLPENSPSSAPSPSLSLNGSTGIPSAAADIAPPAPATLLALATSSSSKLRINQLTLLMCLPPPRVFHGAAFLKRTPFI
ncbi:non-specific lipid transfer protein GPI-anchored 25 [Rhodamnia argentea]|uniref:Non-specific lipid transfer protein GPI-anchored 25 n=1 Tax=Rhodamnia argentea TaxID=178133 RepID=A0A8B8QA85_9MYRT|nr:non-specific lipid transfer protein GPI-anchored 25 [Rhodamnia argentea]